MNCMDWANVRMNKLYRSIKKRSNCFKVQCSQSRRKPCWAFKSAKTGPGINVFGYFLSEIGLGESARLIYSALEQQRNVSVAACNRPLPGRENDLGFSKTISDPLDCNVSISVDGLNGFGGVAKEVCRQRLNFAVPFWELETITAEYLEELRKFDYVLAPTEFIYNNLIQNGCTHGVYFRHPLHIPGKLPQFGMRGDRLKFLFFFDFDSFASRKNPEAVIAAFKQAFGKKDDVVLTVKARGENDRGRRDWLVRCAAEDARINLIDATLSRSEIAALVQSHDVFVSLHRAEGLGLGCAEAMALGKIVVATDYGGTTDFVSPVTGFPVSWKRITLSDDDYLFGKGASWADPSIEDAAAQLRQVYDNPQHASERAKAGYEFLLKHHAFQAAGSNLMALIADKTGVVT